MSINKVLLEHRLANFFGILSVAAFIIQCYKHWPCWVVMTDTYGPGT